MEDLPFNSCADEIAWPAVLDLPAMAVGALLFQLDRSQWWPADVLWRHQASQLRRLAAHAQGTVPFYGERLAGLADETDDDRFLAAWRQVPVLTRAEIQAAGDDLVSTALPETHGGTGEIFTSGSTGKPVRALRTQLWEMFWSAITVRDHLWHRRDFSGTLAVIRESGAGKHLYPDGQVADNWGRSTGALFRTGNCVSLNVTTPVDQQVEWLERQNPDYLLTHPSIAERLARRCLETGVRLPRLRQVETIAEALRPRVRELCAEAWGVPVADMYSTREAGYIALQCPDSEVYHVQAEVVLVEVLDPSGRPCRPGEAGSVVVTPLHNFAMPLIRYELGDVAEVGGPCSCGRGLPVLTRILGRRQNMLVMPTGEERWPMLSSSDIKVMTALAPVRQYQFIQRRPELIEMRLAVHQPLTAEETTALRDWVQQKFGYPFEVTFTVLDEISAGPSDKFEDFVSEVSGRR